MDLDQHEQGELVQKWLRNNGSSLITGIAMGLLLVFGWQWWQGKGVRHQEEAASQYLVFSDAITAKNAEKAKALSGELADKYADTPYAELAALRNAAFLHETGKSADAIALLRAYLPKVKQADNNWQCWIRDPDEHRIELMQMADDSLQGAAIARLRTT